MAFKVGDAIKIPWRKAKPIAVNARLYEAVTRMRSALIVAAKRRSTLTYSELAAAIDKIYIERGLTKALDLLAYDCQERKEPSLAALVVAMAGPYQDRCFRLFG